MGRYFVLTEKIRLRALLILVGLICRDCKCGAASRYEGELYALTIDWDE